MSGEGEAVILDLVKKLEHSNTIKPIPSVTTLINGHLMYGGNRERIKDLDTTAFPDFSDFDLKDYNDADNYANNPKDIKLELPLYTSRGCVARCKFCVDYKMWHLSYRRKSPERLLKEMSSLFEKYGVADFIFVELVMNGTHPWMHKFADALNNSPFEFRYWSLARMDHRLTLELLQKLRKSGLFHLNFGMESASPKMLKLMNKGNTIETIKQNIVDCKKAGVCVDLNVVVGFPGENLWDILQTIWFFIKYRKCINDPPNLSPCDAIVGTDLYLHPEQFDIVIDYEDPNCSNNWRSKDGKNTLEHRLKMVKLYRIAFSFITFGEHKRKSLFEKLREIKKLLMPSNQKKLSLQID